MLEVCKPVPSQQSDLLLLIFYRLTGALDPSGIICINPGKRVILIGASSFSAKNWRLGRGKPDGRR